MKMKLIGVPAVILFLSFVGCKKESLSEKSSISYQLKTSNTSSAMNRISSAGRTEAGTILWTGGSAFANQIKFEAKNSSGEVEFKQNIQQQIDLFAATSSLGTITLPPGTYSEVEFKALLVQSGNKPALELTGTFTTGGISRPIVFRVSANVEVKAEKNNVTVVSGTNYSALNTIDLSQLTRGVTGADLSNATLSGGSIILSSNSNSAIYNTILNNLSSRHGEAEVEHH
ncbi:MAG: hypothetical protein M3Y85_09205 [Bacteroidota bacterium]|nr:hypothetical protein [Bacteroidota bacterium]